MTSSVAVEQHGSVALIRMNHGKVNALDVELLIALREAFESVAHESAVVITGNGRAFSAGLDLRSLLAAELTYSDSLLRELVRTSITIFDSERPVIAAVDGPAIAGGAILALAADMRLMSHGVIGLPELHVGVPFPPALIEIARHVMGHHLQQHLLGGVAVDAQSALTVNMIDAMVESEDLVDLALEKAHALAEVPKGTYALVKAQLHAPANAAIAAVPGGRDEEVREAWKSDDVRAGIQAQVERMSKR
ncbi:MAG: enoyl-CoA hydratase/isomerase family protein [Candidatus Nanopelagicales bacterium]